MKWPGLISLEKPKRKDISLHDCSWAWRTRLFKFKWRKPCVGLRHFFFWILSKLVRSWRWPICREMTGISRHVCQRSHRKQHGTIVWYPKIGTLKLLKYVIPLIVGTVDDFPVPEKIKRKLSQPSVYAPSYERVSTVMDTAAAGDVHMTADRGRESGRAAHLALP